MNDKKILRYESLDSTNAEAKRLVRAAVASGDAIPFGTIIISREQTAGIGRMGRNFYSPPGESLYMSFIMKPGGEAEEVQLATVAAAVAVCETIDETGKLAGPARRPEIKWVNDIYLDGRKICGILAEAMSGSAGVLDTVILGIGININIAPEEFPPEIRDRASSLPLPSGLRETFIERLAENITRDMEKLRTPHGRAPILEYYRDRSFVIGRKISFLLDGEPVQATAIAIEDDGGLLAECEDGKRISLRSGEVSLTIE